MKVHFLHAPACREHKTLNRRMSKLEPNGSCWDSPSHHLLLYSEIKSHHFAFHLAVSPGTLNCSDTHLVSMGIRCILSAAQRPRPSPG